MKSHAERSAADAQGVPEPPAAACTRSTTAAAESMDGVMEAMLAYTYDVQAPVERSPPVASPPRHKRRVEKSDAMPPLESIPAGPAMPPFPKEPPTATNPNAEPIRALNLLLQRLGLRAEYNETEVDASGGIWTCEAKAGGEAVVGEGRGKKAAKREACKKLLATLEPQAVGE